MTRLLLAGVSTRAAAESAARAGFTVTALDAFADLDQHPAVRALSLGRDFGVRFTPPAVARAAKAIESDAVAYLSSFENHPRAIAALAAGRELLGNPPSVVSQVRDPQIVARALRRQGIPALRVRLNAPTHGKWIVKPLASGGGRGARVWRAGTRVSRASYLQQFVDGTPGSIAFVAAGGRARPLAVTRQIVGDRAFGAAGFQYCGNILEPMADARVVRRACAIARAVASEFGLVGVNGVDFVARDGVPYPIEVNPRWSASMELVDRVHDVTVFDAHVKACRLGVLPDFDLLERQRGTAASGKAIVFAQHDVVIGDTSSWIAAGVRDVPRPGERIEAGRPVCTVLAEGRDGSACYGELVRRANAVYSDLARWERHVA